MTPSRGEMLAALAQVGAQETMSEDEIRTCVRAAMLRAHPDRGGSSVAMYALLDARKVIEQTAEIRQICPTCEGRKTVKAQGRNWRFYDALCPTCRGSGRKS